MTAIVTDETVQFVLERVHPEHAGHTVRVWWKQVERPYVALVCDCGDHVDLHRDNFLFEQA